MDSRLLSCRGPRRGDTSFSWAEPAVTPGAHTPQEERLGHSHSMGRGLLPRVCCPVSYLIEQFVVESAVYPVDAHVGEEEEGQHAEEDA